MDEPLVPSYYGFSRSSPGAFVVKDNAGLDLVQFQNDGRVLLLKGDLTTGATIQRTTAREFIIQDLNGTIAAKVDTSTGNFYIKGTLTQDANNLRTTANPEFVVRDALEISRQGDSDRARIILDALGNLKLTGNVYPEITP